MGSKTFETDQIKAMFENPTFVPFLIIWITHGIGGFGITFVLPTVIYELGISDTAISQLMTMVSMTNLGVTGARRRLQLLTAPHTASVCRSLPHTAHPRFPHPHKAAQPMGGRDRARGRADHLLYPAHHGQQRNGEVYFRCDSHGGHPELLPNHMAR